MAWGFLEILHVSDRYGFNLIFKISLTGFASMIVELEWPKVYFSQNATWYSVKHFALPFAHIILQTTFGVYYPPRRLPD